MPTEISYGAIIFRQYIISHEEADSNIVHQALASAPFYAEEKPPTEMFMESPTGDRKIIDMKFEKYKQIIPDIFISLHAISGCDTVACCYGVGKATALKILKHVKAGYFSFSHR